LAQSARNTFVHSFGDCDPSAAEVIVALGGDGFMLQTLHATQHLNVPVYGMNRGTVGFLMNEFSTDGLMARLAAAEEAAINPLRMRATCVDGQTQTALAINEVSLLRQGPQAAKLQIFVDDRLRLSELACDGALVATPAGSTGLQLLCAWSYFADWFRGFGADRYGCVSAAQVARGGVA
jgi:NAD+ kinase